MRGRQPQDVGARDLIYWPGRSDGGGNSGGGRRVDGPGSGELAPGVSGLRALALVAATSAHAWPSGPAVPTAVVWRARKEGV